MTSGLILAMPEADYHAHPALSSTGARRLLHPGCPALFDHERRHPMTPTKAMMEGRATHREVLGIGSTIELGDYPDFRTKEAQEWRDAVEATGSVPMLRDGKAWRNVRGMRDALRAHPIFPRLFDPERGDAEASAFWADPETGIECRARFDFLPHRQEGNRLVIPDYKRAEKVDPDGFARSAATYGYPMQADWYLTAAKALGLDADPAFVFVTQMPEPPYLVAVHQVPPDDMVLAAGRNRVARRTFAQCTESGEWPGWPGVNQLDMPTYWRIQSDAILSESEPPA